MGPEDSWVAKWQRVGKSKQSYPSLIERILRVLTREMCKNLKEKVIYILNPILRHVSFQP